MKGRIYILVISILFLFSIPVWSQSSNTDIYLITCDPGTESYSMYGHSAIRVVDTTSNIDLVYNWGVFDFSTPNFNYKFAKGRLDYLLGIFNYNRFLQEYLFEGRAVYSQKVNIEGDQLLQLLAMINENAKPENRSYRYDFFMDNCATRIRDIFEQIYGSALEYPEEKPESIPTYRDRLGEFLGAYPWLHMGIDILIGSPGDNKCDQRGSMFLPDYLMNNLYKATITVNGVTSSLLEPPDTVLEFDRPSMKIPMFREAWFILSIVMLLVLFITFRFRDNLFQKLFDLILFFVLFLLSLLMIFTNFLTDHEAMNLNFNLIWLNPLWLLALPAIFAGKKMIWVWRTQIGLSLFFMIMIVLVKQTINPAFIPIILIVIIRSNGRLKYS